MPRLRRRSLRLRLTVLVAGLFGATLLVAGFAARSQFRSTLEDNARQTGTSLLEDFLSPTPTGLPTVDDASVTRFVYLDDDGNEVPPADFDAIVSTYLDEQLVATYPDLPDGVPLPGTITVDPSGAPAFDELTDEEIAALDDLAGIDPIEFDEAGSVVGVVGVELFVPEGPLTPIDLGDDAVVVGQAVNVGDSELTVAVAVPRQAIDDSVAAATLVGLAAIPLLTLLVAVGTWVATARTLRPVEAIRRQVERTDPTHLDHHVPRPGSGDEIDRLAGTMNDMLDRLHIAGQQQRRFISDASHELRSPITATLATVESSTAKDVRERWPEIAATITDEQRRLGRLVDDLLLLAELDERRDDSPTGHEVDLDELVLGEAARTRSVPVHAHVEEPQRIVGSARLLGRALSNLVDNAARHARGRIDVFLMTDGDRSIIRVDDDGPGVDPDDRALVVDRFARLDEARRKRDGGAGLGLAIVDEVARRHGGELRISASSSGGARFEIVLPMA